MIYFQTQGYGLATSMLRQRGLETGVPGGKLDRQIH